MENQEAYQNAKKRIAAKLGFKIHLIVFVLVILILVLVNYSTSPDVLWVKWPIMGWGIGLFFHALSVYLFPNKTLITEEMIRKEMEGNT